MHPVLLLDTNSLFFRAFHALPPMNTLSGVPTSAVYGFSVLLLKLLREEAPRGLAFARDAPGGTFRHAEFDDYKGRRAPAPTPLIEQFGWLDRLIAASQLPSFAAVGFEADDVLATLAREIRDQGEHVRIVTGDRDLFQLCRDGVDVLFLGRRGQKPLLYDAAAVEERFGVAPSQLPSVMALIGDPSDNLPGIPGVGPRTAAKWIARAGDIPGLLATLDRVEPEGLRETLRRHAEQIRQNARLLRLLDDVPLPDRPRFAALSAEGIAQLRALFAQLEFKSLLGRLPDPRD